MPNIKIYGVLRDIDALYGVAENNDILKEKKKFGILFEKIIKLFENEQYAKDVIVTIVPSVVTDLATKVQPYIQLELNCMRGYKKKVEKLKTLGMDIQVVKLYDFIPKG